MSKIEVDQITQQSGSTLTVGGGACKTATVDATTVTLGRSGGTVSLASGATQSGFGRTGTVDWQTTVKTSTFTAVNGEGYFVNTTSGAITVNLPAGSAGAIVSIADYAGTADTNNITIAANGSEKIQGSTDDRLIITEREAVTLVYIDSTQGWIPIQDANVGGDALITQYAVNYLVVAGGGGSRCFSDTSGGGGAGGYRTAGYGPAPLQAPALNVQPGTSYPITVGGGGPKGTPGSNSIFSSITSTGGGAACAPSITGGSGGAACGAGNTPPVSPPQGNPAGNSGGGGAGGAGGNRPSPSQGGVGGVGAPNCIASGTPFSTTIFAGGGAGGADPPGSSPQPNNPGGGPGGGGVGGSRGNDNSTDGSTNTGGGAGGQGANHAGQSGGSGVVVIRYTTANAPPGTSGGTKSTVGSCTVHVFTGPGTFSA